MSNLTQNTTALQELLAKINNLPAETDLTPIVEALTEKGQTVPDGAGVDVLASLIAAIQAGGGGGLSNVILGTITPAESDSVVTIDTSEYGITTVPRMRFLLETGVYGNKDHTKNRIRLLAHLARSEPPLASGGWDAVCTYNESGSDASKAYGVGTTSEFWGKSTSNCTGTNPLSILMGTSKFNMMIPATSKTWSLLPGRTYIWGIVL